MENENKYREFSTDKVNAYKKTWDRDFFCGVHVVDCIEVIFVGIGILTFIFSAWVYKVLFIIFLLLFYWFRIKLIEKKIIDTKKNLVLGKKFLNESYIGRGVTQGGARPHYDSLKNGFDDYVDFLETQRKHLVARIVILQLFALVLLEIIKQ